MSSSDCTSALTTKSRGISGWYYLYSKYLDSVNVKFRTFLLVEIVGRALLLGFVSLFHIAPCIR